MSNPSDPKNAPQIVYVKTKKSVGVAVILALLFGPLGMFYATVTGAVVMIVVSLLVGIFTMGFGLLVTIPIGAVWAGMAASTSEPN